MDYKSFSVKELEALLHDEQKRFKKLIKEGRNVDMTRGRPAKEQLEIAMPMLRNAGSYNYSAETADARNYGDLGGTKACKALFAELFGVKICNIKPDYRNGIYRIDEETPFRDKE